MATHPKYNVIFLVVLLIAVPAFAADQPADKNGVSPNTISLPSGPGSIEGLGESFQPMLNTGSARYGIKIALPGGVNGNTPEVSLHYDSGNGDGFAGIGWSFGPGSISRQTDKGIPRYGDDAFDELGESDRFVGPDGEELVEIDNGVFRARIEENFIRYRQVGDHWEADLKDGTLLEFGATSQAKITDDSGTRIFRWLLEKSTDVNGNVIQYTYAMFNGSENQKYLREIRYGSGASPWQAFYFVFFSYEYRPDWRKDYRSGFLIRTSRRLERIDAGVQGVLPEKCTVGDWNQDGTSDALIRSYVLSYNDSSGIVSTLSKVTLFGPDQASYLPPMSFSYSTLTTPPGSTLSASDAVISSINAPVSVMDNSLSELIDMNLDGLPDILKTDYLGGRHTCYVNRGVRIMDGKPVIEWDAGADVANSDQLALSLYLNENRVHLADMDGNGISDLIHTSMTGDVYYHLNSGNLEWSSRKRMSIQDTAPPPPFGDDRVKTSDLDFNKRMDVVKSSENGYSVWFNLQDGRYSGQVRTPGAFWRGQALLFSDKTVRLADMNGDRLQDVVKITATRVVFCASMGHGRFDDAIELTIPGVTLTSGPGEQTERAQLQDINGDGLADFVLDRATVNELWFWLNTGADAFAQRTIIKDLPRQYGIRMATRWADLNGNGTTDLIYADSEADDRIRFLDLGELIAGSHHPNLMTGIDNGLGVKTKIFYRPSTEYCVQAYRDGNPWQITLPFPVSVISKVITTTGMDLDDILGEDRYIKEYTYRDGFYDDLERAFRGFEQVTVTEYGDASAPTTLHTYRFYTGGPDREDNDQDQFFDEVSIHGHREEEALKGKTRETDVRDANNVLFSKETLSWQIKTLKTGADGSEIRFAFTTDLKQSLYEGTNAPEILTASYQYDGFGNQIEEKRFGAVSLSGDELFTFTEYVNIDDENRWLIGIPVRELKKDAAGNPVAETKFYYDGNAYIGLAYGEVEKGNLTRQEGWVKDGVYLNLIRNEYDAYGNLIGIMDGNGNKRTLAYDSVFHAYPIRETIPTGTGTPDLTLSAGYHLGFGTITQSTDFNGHITRYGYDRFGRLVNIVRPGDSDAYPTLMFSYAMSDPANKRVYRYDAAGNLTLETGIAAPSSVKTRLREISGQSGTFDTIQYSDGLGRKLAVAEEAETGFVVKDAVRFNAKGANRFVFMPYPTNTDAFALPDNTLPKTEIRYDASGRDILNIHPPDASGTIAQTAALYLPLKKTTLDENGVPKTVIQDGLERIIEVHEQNAGDLYITRYAYDPLNNLTRITDAQSNVKTIMYDGLSRKTEMNDPDAGKKRYEYDAAGNLTRATDNKGQTILYAYDSANRMLAEDYLDAAGISPDVSYHYDAPNSAWQNAANLKGRLAWVADLTGSQIFSYDARGNALWTVKQIRDGSYSENFKTAYTYDAMDRMTTMTYPDGDVIGFTYNAASLPESVPGILNNMDYHPSSQLNAVRYGNGVETRYMFDPRQRMTSLSTQHLQTGHALQQLSYSYDGASNITAISDARPPVSEPKQNASQSFEYDDLYRLTQAEGLGYGMIRYGYDKIGNVTFKKSPDSPTAGHIEDPLVNLGTLSYGGIAGSSHRAGRLPGDPPGPHAVTAAQNGFAYDYDDNGNMTLHEQGDIYDWDFKDRLIRIRKGTVETCYVYDYQGQRIIKKVKNETGEKPTYYVSKAFEVREGQALKYVFSGARRAAQIQGGLNTASVTEYQAVYLQEGWNFFSPEIEPDQPGITAALEPIAGKYTEVWTTDPTFNKYVGYAPSLGIHDLTELHANTGYLIYVTSSATLILSGTREAKTIPLVSGWNLIGSPVSEPTPIVQAMAPLDGKYEAVWYYDTNTHAWKYFDPTQPEFLNDLETIEPGKSYWIKMKFEAQITTVIPPAKVLFYHPDHLGSTNVVTNAAGTEMERIEYYPFGRPRYEMQSGYAYKYTGKELDAESGLMYYEARYYDSVVGKFASMDPLADHPNQIGKSPYSAFWNNPIVITDPDGRCPNCPDDVYIPIADHVYKKDLIKGDKTSNGWEVVEIDRNDKSGYVGALYKGTFEGKTEYIYATRGTEPSFKDVGNDIGQLAGISQQYKESVGYALKWKNIYGEVSFTGHSLGGGLASANALKTGGKAVTFNAAGISKFTKASLNLKSSANITAYIVEGEALDYSQSKIGVRAEGKIIILPFDYITGRFALETASYRIIQRNNNHRMSNVIEQFNLRKNPK